EPPAAASPLTSPAQRRPGCPGVGGRRGHPPGPCRGDLRRRPAAASRTVLPRSGVGGDRRGLRRPGQQLRAEIRRAEPLRPGPGQRLPGRRRPPGGDGGGRRERHRPAGPHRPDRLPGPKGGCCL
ncbi:MAG: hypothetical protein AVDCRST_MAG10-231, partial [uncultured Acidimicrobiales bacterium]